MNRLRRIPSMLKRTLLELNLFKSEVTDSNDQSQIRYQRQATRLYIILLALSLIIFTLYVFLTPQRQVETVNNPTAANFSDLQSRYNSSLLCTCSNIYVPYNVFLTIEPHYHQICSSDLVSKTWLNNLGLYSQLPQIFTRGSGGKVLYYAFNGVSQFLLLKVLCSQSNQTINNSLQEFLNRKLVTTQAISKNLFELQATTLIEDWKVITIKNFLRTLQLIRVTQHGNHLAAADSNSRFYVKMMLSKSLVNSSVYYDKCNCMVNASCHSPMLVVNEKLSVFGPLFEIPGFFMGCFRLEALLSSTLECFYNQTCMDIVNAKTYSLLRLPFNFTALNATRNSPNESIYSVASQLFVDKWSNYSSFNNYYTACAPRSCTYEYMRRRKLVFLITSIIGMFGGLTTVLTIIFLVLLRLMAKVRLFVITFFF
jgi:hypothetical protein